MLASCPKVTVKVMNDYEHDPKFSHKSYPVRLHHVSSKDDKCLYKLVLDLCTVC